MNPYFPVLLICFFSCLATGPAVTLLAYTINQFPLNSVPKLDTGEIRGLRHLWRYQ